MLNKAPSGIAISGMCVLSSAGETASALCARAGRGEQAPAQIDLRSYEKEIDAIETGPHELYRVQKLLLAATVRALRMAGMPIGSASIERAGIFFGNTYGVEEFKAAFFQCYKKSDPSLTSPVLFPFTTANALGCWLAIQVGAKGPNLTFVSGTVSSSEAIIAACDALSSGACETALVGGVSIVNNDFMCEQRDSGFKNELVGILIMEKADRMITDGRTPIALISDCRRGTISSEQIEKITNERSGLIHCGDNLGDELFISLRSAVAVGRRGRKSFCLDEAVGNAFDAAGVFGVILAAELLRAPEGERWIPLDITDDDIGFLNINSYGAVVTTVIRRA